MVINVTGLDPYQDSRKGSATKISVPVRYRYLPYPTYLPTLPELIVLVKPCGNVPYYR